MRGNVQDYNFVIRALRNIEFHINKVQVSYRYEDITQDAATFKNFLNKFKGQ